MNINIILKKYDGKEHVTYLKTTEIKDIYFYDDYIEFEFYSSKEEKEAGIVASTKIPKKQIETVKLYDF